MWKKTFVVPVFKSGNKSDVKNYRPITIMGSVVKVLDAVIAKKLSEEYLLKIAEEQHGFMKGKSTLTNLLVNSDFVAKAMNEYKQVDTIYLDFQKAFDTVDHNLLVYKLFNLGMRGSLLKWFKSYLSDRVNKEKIGNFTSDPYVVFSGAPQDSHLGPLLFIIFINDIISWVRFSKILIYADDIKLFVVVNSKTDPLNLQADLEKISA